MDNTLKHFSFLTSEFGYGQPLHKAYQQENGAITRDDISYENPAAGRVVLITNAYHPYDYGFEMNVRRLDTALSWEDKQMLYYVLKENQDLEQSFIESAAQLLKDKFAQVLRGEEWMADKTGKS